METGRETLKQQAYRIIKNKILYCEYAPKEVLNEELLLQDTGYSRAPIRDALGRLEQEHLLVIMPKKGIRISDVNMNDISSVFEMRCMVEPYVIRMYGNRLDKEKLREYKKKFETDITPEKVMDAAKEKRLIEMFTLDDEFHQYIVRNSPNPYMWMSMELIYNQNTRLRVLTSLDLNRLMQSKPEHAEIIDALLEDRYEDAADKMKNHLRKAKQGSLDTFASYGDWLRKKEQDPIGFRP